jgi:hypothetical protein
MFVRALFRAWLVISVVSLALACNSDSPPMDPPFADDGGIAGDGETMAPDGDVVPPPILEPDDTLTVSGTVIDFVTGDPIASAATVTTVGVTPPPTVTTTGSNFSVELPPYSTFHLLAASLPSHRATFGDPITVEAMALEGVYAPTVSEAYLAELATYYGVTPAPGTSIVIGQLVDGYGEPRAGVSADTFELAYAPSARGPYFLGDDLSPTRDPESSGRGYFVFFDAPVDGVQVVAAPGSAYTVGGSAPSAAGAVTIVEVTVDGEPPPVVEDVSFSRDVVPIFTNRGCVVCHSGGGIGRDEGGLTLGSGSSSLIHRELTEEISPNDGITRIDREDPENSLVLRMPSFETPPDRHPNVTFVDATDPDYQIILAWIREGAYEN